MQLLACDFDGTLFCNHEVSERDMAAIAAWRAQGNLFGIVTGRGAGTLLADVRRFPLTWDFLLCNNGALLLDEHARLLAQRPLEQDLARHLLDHELQAICSSCALFSGLEMYILEGSGPWLNPVYTPGVLAADRARETSFLQISFGFRERADSIAWGQRLQEELSGRARVQCSLSVADVTSPLAGKATGIAWAMEVLGRSPAAIVTAGDDGNDTDMLASYEGYAMAGSDAHVLAAAGGRIVASVAELAEKHL